MKHTLSPITAKDRSATIRTAIFGGSFNPIHRGHIALARQVVEQGLADEVWLLVSPQNPLKQQSDLLPENTRLHLARLALDGIDGVEASDFEFSLARPTYTWKTLDALRTTYPERSFSLLIGADNWLLFNRWAHYEEILQSTPLLIYPRPGYELNPAQTPLPLPSSARLIEAPLFPFSSTDVRRAIRSSADCSEMLPQSAAEAIVEAFRKN